MKEYRLSWLGTMTMWARQLWSDSRQAENAATPRREWVAHRTTPSTITCSSNGAIG